MVLIVSRKYLSTYIKSFFTRVVKANIHFKTIANVLPVKVFFIVIIELFNEIYF